MKRTQICMKATIIVIFDKLMRRQKIACIVVFIWDGVVANQRDHCLLGNSSWDCFSIARKVNTTGIIKYWLWRISLPSKVGFLTLPVSELTNFSLISRLCCQVQYGVQVWWHITMKSLPREEVLYRSADHSLYPQNLEW